MALRALLVLIGMAALSQAADLTTLDGKKHTGDIVSFNAKEVVFKTTMGDKSFDFTSLNAIDFTAAKGPASGTKYIEIELIDGSRFHCGDFKIKGKNVVATLLGNNQVIEFPASTLLYMVRDISDLKLSQAFREILSKRGKRDIWIVLKNETLDGLTGTFGDGDAKGDLITFEPEANPNKINIQMSRIYGMIFNPPPLQVAQTVCRVVDAGKNVMYAKALSLAEGKVIVESITGVKIEYPGITSLAKLDFSAGSMMYLSNADPIKVDQSSTEGIAEPYRRDRNLDNSDLKINNVKYPKGLALHSRTVLTYDLNGQYKQFQAIAGVDDCVEGESKVTLTIEADFKPIFKGVVTKRDKPKMLNLAVLNVKELRITVESDFLDLGNQLNLVDAKVLK